MLESRINEHLHRCPVSIELGVRSTEQLSRTLEAQARAPPHPLVVFIVADAGGLEPLAVLLALSHQILRSHFRELDYVILAVSE